MSIHKGIFQVCDSLNFKAKCLNVTLNDTFLAEKSDFLKFHKENVEEC